jgi:hypothetical protein
VPGTPEGVPRTAAITRNCGHKKSACFRMVGAYAPSGRAAKPGRWMSSDGRTICAVASEGQGQTCTACDEPRFRSDPVDEPVRDHILTHKMTPVGSYVSVLRLLGGLLFAFSRSILGLSRRETSQ